MRVWVQLGAIPGHPALRLRPQLPLQVFISPKETSLVLTLPPRPSFPLLFSLERVILTQVFLYDNYEVIWACE